MTLCGNCGKETNNPKYCSSRCAAIKTNQIYPKRKTKKVCLVCSKPVSSWRKSRCDYHTEEYKRNKYQQLTLGEYRNKLSVLGKHPSWVHAHIRNFARSWLKDMRQAPCEECGYTKHVELAHIKDVSSFPDSALLSEVNSRENVRSLCPNCHWEFDHNK